MFVALLSTLIAMTVPALSATSGSGVTSIAMEKAAAYPSYADMLAQIETWKRRYPNLIHETTLGKTVEGRPIPLLRLSDDREPNPKEPGVLIMTGIHPREAQPPACLLWLMEELLGSYGLDERITKLVKGRQIYFIPMLNVDGKLYDETAKPPKPGQDWRKNRRKIEGTTRIGVDLNRNFPVRWGGYRETDTSWNDRTSRPGGNIYEGPSALSEPESKALADFFAAHSADVRLFVDFHSPLRKTILPAYLYGEDADRYAKLGAGVRDRQKDNPYPVTVIKKDSQPAAGIRNGNTGLTYTYAYYVHGIYGLNIEIGLNGDKADGESGGDLIGRHYPPVEGVRAEYRANIREPLLYLIEAAGDLPPVGERKPLPLSPMETDGSLSPGGTASLKPQLINQPPGFAVLISESPIAVVQSEVRAVPLKNGFTVHISDDAKPGDKISFRMIVWDEDRNRYESEFYMNVSSQDRVPKDGAKKK